MLKVGGDETAQGETDGRSLLDEIAREGARRMLVAALETEVVAYLEAHREEATRTATPWSSATARGGLGIDGRGGDDPGECASGE